MRARTVNAQPRDAGVALQLRARVCADGQGNGHGSSAVEERRSRCVVLATRACLLCCILCVTRCRVPATHGFPGSRKGITIDPRHLHVCTTACAPQRQPCRSHHAVTSPPCVCVVSFHAPAGRVAIRGRFSPRPQGATAVRPLPTPTSPSHPVALLEAAHALWCMRSCAVPCCTCLRTRACACGGSEMVPLAIGRLSGTLLEVAGNVGCGKRRFVDDLVAHIRATRLKVRPPA